MMDWSFFFCKQKTAYELRISDWSSDVCSSDLRLGVLDNTKWNGNKLLRRASARLNEEFGFAAVNYYRKESFSKYAAPELIDEIANRNDIVLTAIGD